MDTKSLYDLIALSECGSFSKASEQRFITQPAFSRRIRNLENWFGIELVDRSHYPTKLTPEGKLVLETAIKVIDELNRCKQEIDTSARGEPNTLRFAMPHSLSIGFFPNWFSKMEALFGSTNVNVSTGNIHDSAQMLDSDSCDFAIFYNFDLALSYSFSDPRFSHAYIGRDTLIPVGAADSNGNGLFSFEEGKVEPIPYLSWSPPTLVNHALSELFRRNDLAAMFQTRYQNQLAAALREETILGKGVAWLPTSLIHDDLSTGKLIKFSSSLDVSVKIGIARNKKNLSEIVESWWESIK